MPSTKVEKGSSEGCPLSNLVCLCNLQSPLEGSSGNLGNKNSGSDYRPSAHQGYTTIALFCREELLLFSRLWRHFGFSLDLKSQNIHKRKEVLYFLSETFFSLFDIRRI